MEKQLTPREQWEKMQAEKKEAIQARIDAEIAAGFLNPFGEGVSYDVFLANIQDGKSVREYLTGKLVGPEVSAEKEAELIDWIEKDLEYYAPYKDFLKGSKKTKNK